MRALLACCLLSACSKPSDGVKRVPESEKVGKPDAHEEPAVPSEELTWNEPAKMATAECVVGERHTAHCPPRAVDSAVWGSGLYTTDSALCVAALHAGKITASGGLATYEIRAGQAAYVGSARNGVSTQSWADYKCSFAFAGSKCATGMSLCEGICSDLQTDSQHCGSCDHACSASESCRSGACSLGVDATWTTNAVTPVCSGIRVYVCPARGAALTGPVWGTDVYTHDSAICAAAVHAGALSSSGTVTLEYSAGLASYKGSTRRGITSNSWGSWTCSYRFR